MFLSHPSPADSRPWAYFAKYDWSPFLLMVYRSPLTRVVSVCGPSPHLVKTYLCLYSIFQSAFFMRVCFLWRKRNIVLDSGRECHTKGWKRDGKRPKKKSIFFHYTWPSVVNSLHNCTCSTRTVAQDNPAFELWRESRTTEVEESSLAKRREKARLLALWRESRATEVDKFTV
jgi:hypothetical protein